MAVHKRRPTMKTISSNIRHHTAKPSSRITNIPISVMKEATNKRGASLTRISKPSLVRNNSDEESTCTATDEAASSFHISQRHHHHGEASLHSTYTTTDEDFLEADVSFFDIPTGGIIIMPSHEDF